MTATVSSGWRRPFASDWPPLVRVAIGGAVGWAIAAWIADVPDSAWGNVAAALTMSLVALGAPMTARVRTLGGVSAWALASTIGLYVGVPETNHVLGVGAGFGVFVLGELTGRCRGDALTVVALAGVLVWAITFGTGGRGTAAVAGYATLGLIALWPAVALLPGPRRGLTPAAVRAALLTAVDAVAVVLIGRRGAIVQSVEAMTLTAVLALAALVVVARIVYGSRT
jgi:hypothetical protein